MSMSKSRFDRIMSGMNSAPRKVFDYIPIAEHWDLKQVIGEIRRCGGNSDARVVSGCVTALVRAGLVNELDGKFRREAIKPILSKPKLPEDDRMANVTKPAPAVKAAPVARQAPMDVLGELAARAENIASLLKSLASDIGDAAVEIQASIESNDADMLKYKQLKALLQGI